MKKLWLTIPLAIAAMFIGVPVQAAEVSVVALPNPIGIPEMMLVIAMTGFALWKKDWIRIILSLCIVTWGAFFMPYDAKVAAPLLGVGVVLFVMGVLTQVSRSRETASEV